MIDALLLAQLLARTDAEMLFFRVSDDPIMSFDWDFDLTRHQRDMYSEKAARLIDLMDWHTSPEDAGE